MVGMSAGRWWYLYIWPNPEIVCQDLGRLNLPVTVSTPEEFLENPLDNAAWLARHVQYSRHMAKSRNSVSGPGPAKSTSNGQHTRGIHRKETREYSLACQAVLSSAFSVNSSGVLTITGRFNWPRSWHYLGIWPYTISQFLVYQLFEVSHA